MKLLMGNELYESHLFVRELLQNALDALRHRSALCRSGKVEWSDGKVHLKHFLDEHGYEIVRCTDNGVGMDLHIVKEFLTSAGRSYYRSSEFEQERAVFRAADCDFDPCARFGIGFMSCFMFGDQIKITTRRDNGVGRDRGDPIVVEIQGLSGIVTIRPGADDQPVGTCVEIRGRRKPLIVDEWDDRLLLVEVVKGYAIATEYPIVAECTVPGIEARADVPTEFSPPGTLLESAGIKGIGTFEESFADIDPCLQGVVRVSVLVDSEGVPAIATPEARWRVPTEGKEAGFFRLATSDGKSVGDLDFHAGQVACDGILVCGSPGRGERLDRLGVRYSVIRLGRDVYVLDARGELKPHLSPSRRPAERPFHPHVTWTRLSRVAERAYARIWEQIAALTGKADQPETLWQLASVHWVDLGVLRADAIAKHVAVCLCEGEDHCWTRISDLPPLWLLDTGENDQRGWTLQSEDGRSIGFPDSLASFAAKSNRNVTVDSVEGILASVGLLSVSQSRLQLRFDSIECGDDDPGRRYVGHRSVTKLVAFADELKSCVSVQSHLDTANRNHPLTRFAVDADDVVPEHRSALQEFCWSFVRWRPRIDEAGKVDRWHRKLGILYRAVNWKSESDELKPPYHIWVRDTGIVEVTEEHFERWAESRIDGK